MVFSIGYSGAASAMAYGFSRSFRNLSTLADTREPKMQPQMNAIPRPSQIVDASLMLDHDAIALHRPQCVFESPRRI
jgi:hypothetical protein